MIWVSAVLGIVVLALVLGRPRPAGERLPQDRTPFGEALARRMWHRVMGSAMGRGILPSLHKEYCGHGLVRVPEGVVLCEVFDMEAQTAMPLAAWTEEAEFVAFFARQSNHSVNGFDPAEPVFFTDGDRERGNQRLTREAIEAAL